MHAIRNFINAYFKNTDYTVPKAVSIQDSYEESDPETPIIFIMAPGVDPTENLKRYAEELGVIMAPISLGKGQEAKAKAILKSASQSGRWCFLSNCHLSVQLLPELENMMDEIFADKYDPTFRVLMSAAPVPKGNEGGQFPISLLQRSIKQAVEPPRGIKANVCRTYSNMPKVFTRCENDMGFRKAVYGLVWYHALLIERKKFKSLGWNTAYSFNDSDYQVCEDQLAQYMGRYVNDLKDDKFNAMEPVPWDAVRELIGQCNYGGRVTDNSDRTLLMVYTKEIFNDDLIGTDKWKPPGTEHEPYSYIVDESNTKANVAELWTPDVFTTEIQAYMHEGPDPTSCFGQHPNAEISSQIADTAGLLQDIVSLQPLVVEGSPKEKTAMLLKKIKELAEIVPAAVDIGELKHKLAKDDNPLNTVLLQEM
jgi:dynein heavy chain, axonemal